MAAGRDLGRGAPRARGLVRVLSADWVVPVEGPTHPRRRRLDRRRRADRERRAGRRARRRRALSGRRDPPRLRQRAHAPRVHDLRGFRRRALVRALDRAPRRAEGADRASRRWRRSRGSERSSACAPGSRRSGTAASEAPLRRPAPSSGCAPSSISRSSGGTLRRSAERFEPMRERIAGALSDRVALGISPHAPYTCTLELYEACAELGLPMATHLAESDEESEFLKTGGGTWQAFAEMLVPPLGTTGITRARGRRAARPAHARRTLRPGR